MDFGGSLKITIFFAVINVFYAVHTESSIIFNTCCHYVDGKSSCILYGLFHFKMILVTSHRNEGSIRGAKG